MLHHFVCWYVKCVEKVPFRKSGHIYDILKFVVFPDIINVIAQKGLLLPPPINNVWEN